jgi:hypothetical protein
VACREKKSRLAHGYILHRYDNARVVISASDESKLIAFRVLSRTVNASYKKKGEK